MKKEIFKGLLTICLVLLFFCSGYTVQAAQKNVIKIGIIGPLAFKSFYGSVDAAEMAAEEINNAGGVKVGQEMYKITIVKEDSNEYRSIPDAVTAFERLVSTKKPDFIMGGARSEAVLAQMELMADYKVIYLGIGVASSKINLRVGDDYERYKYWFRYIPLSEIDQFPAVFGPIHTIIKKVRSELGIEKPRVALLMESGTFVDPVVKNAKTVFPKMGVEVVGTWRISHGAKDVSTELAAIKKAGAHVIHSITAGPSGLAVAKQWGELKIPAAIGGWNTQAIQGNFWNATNGTAKYYAALNWIMRVPLTETTVDFWDKCIEKFGEATFNHVAGYDNTYILKEAIEAAGSLNADKVIKALEEIKYVGTIGRLRVTPPDSKKPHDLLVDLETPTNLAFQWMGPERSKWRLFWPDGEELHSSILAVGIPPGWDTIQHKSLKEYILPPWMVEYWKSKAMK
jgi:branched-chain amino acid transport system substrate-binding protein